MKWLDFRVKFGFTFFNACIPSVSVIRCMQYAVCIVDACCHTSYACFYIGVKLCLTWHKSFYVSAAQHRYRDAHTHTHTHERTLALHICRAANAFSSRAIDEKLFDGVCVCVRKSIRGSDYVSVLGNCAMHSVCMSRKAIAAFSCSHTDTETHMWMDSVTHTTESLLWVWPLANTFIWLIYRHTHLQTSCLRTHTHSGSGAAAAELAVFIIVCRNVWFYDDDDDDNSSSDDDDDGVVACLLARLLMKAE